MEILKYFQLSVNETLIKTWASEYTQDRSEMGFTFSKC